MEGCDGTADGRPDTLVYRRYQRFGHGGCKLIWFEASAVVPEGRANTRQLLINKDTAAGQWPYRSWRDLEGAVKAG